MKDSNFVLKKVQNHQIFPYNANLIKHHVADTV